MRLPSPALRRAFRKQSSKDAMRSSFLFALPVLCTISLTSFAARAEEPRQIGAYKDWSAFVYTENGAKVCYMASEPKKHEGNYDKRGDIYALITHRPADGTKGEFSYISGYSYKKDQPVSLRVDAKAFDLFTHDETAWAQEGDDAKIVKALRAGSNMIVKGTSSRGTDTIDTFSLKGSSAAYDAISRECGVR